MGKSSGGLLTLRPRTLQAQISLGFAVVLLLHLLVALMSHFGLERAARSAEESQLRADAVTRVVQTESTVVALQRNVLAFMYTGDVSLAEYVRSTEAELEESLHELDSKIGSELELQALPKMHDALRAYRSGFDSVVTDRGRRERLMRDSVFPYLESSRRVIVDVIDEAGRLADTQLVAEAGRCLQSFSGAEASISAYLLEPGGQVVREFRSHVATGRECLGRLKSDALPPTLQRELEQVIEGTDDWESSVYQVVNSTRSYLHLVNVVLAGQAHEFLTLSSRLTDAAIRDQRQKDTVLAASQKRYQTLANLIGALTVIGGLIAGYLISRSVSKPISAMTETFSALAQGREEPVADLGRRDEIGEMARAAAVFAQRNRETRELLVRANVLTEEQAVMNKELARNVEELEQRNEDLDSFSYSASHDLRAPLRGITLLADWIKEDAGETLNDVAAGHLELLRSRARRLGGLLEGLLEYSKSGRSPDAVETVAVLQLVAETVEGLSFGPSTQITLEGDDARVETPRIAIQKVIQNLVSNAVSHHDKDEQNVVIRVRDGESNVQIEVEDDGPGIPLALQDRVFQIFQTVKSRDEHESSGIGLALVQKISNVHGAKVELCSDDGEGCTFLVTWPKRSRSEANSIVESRSAASDPDSALPGLRPSSLAAVDPTVPSKSTS